MLKLYFNTFGTNDEILHNPNYIDNPKSWFDNQGGRHFVTGDFERALILDIDKSTVINENMVVNPTFGGIAIQEISTTSKTAILVKNLPQYIFNGSRMGENAAAWLLKIGEMQDVTVRMGYLMPFQEPFRVLIANSNKIVTSWREYIFEAVKFL